VSPLLLYFEFVAGGCSLRDCRTFDW